MCKVDTNRYLLIYIIFSAIFFLRNIIVFDLQNSIINPNYGACFIILLICQNEKIVTALCLVGVITAHWVISDNAQNEYTRVFVIQ